MSHEEDMAEFLGKLHSANEAPVPEKEMPAAK
jgi:hypothetical protein